MHLLIALQASNVPISQSFISRIFASEYSKRYLEPGFLANDLHILGYDSKPISMVKLRLWFKERIISISITCYTKYLMPLKVFPTLPES